MSAPKKAAKKAPKSTSVVVETAHATSGARAVHARVASSHAVGIGDLRVMIVRESDGCWFAQGLEIDFAEQGTSLEDVQERFESGLTSTIHEHLTVQGNLHGLLRAAPSEVWTEFLTCASEHRFRLTTVSAHDVTKAISETKIDGQAPVKLFDKIAYHLPVAEAAVCG